MINLFFTSLALIYYVIFFFIRNNRESVKTSIKMGRICCNCKEDIDGVIMTFDSNGMIKISTSPRYCDSCERDAKLSEVLNKSKFIYNSKFYATDKFLNIGLGFNLIAIILNTAGIFYKPLYFGGPFLFAGVTIWAIHYMATTRKVKLI